MSWSTVQYFTIRCDAEGCTASITRITRNVTGARCEAAGEGWRLVNARQPFSHGPAIVFDFCPDHPDDHPELAGPPRRPGAPAMRSK